MKNGTFSEEHRKFLLSRKKKDAFVVFFRIFLLAALLGIWELLAVFQKINPFITSSPSRIIRTLKELYLAKTLFYHVGVTLYETLIGFLIAVGGGCLIALTLWWSESVRRVAEPYLVVINALPKIALGPLLIIWFGTGTKAIVSMTVLVGIVVATMNMLSGFTATDENKLLLLRSLGASKIQILTKLVVPSALPSFISMLKISVGMAWIGSIMGEYIVSKAGIGYLIVYGGQVFKLDLVMASVFVLCLLAAGMYAIVAALEKIFLKNGKN